MSELKLKEDFFDSFRDLRDEIGIIESLKIIGELIQYVADDIDYIKEHKVIDQSTRKIWGTKFIWEDILMCLESTDPDVIEIYNNLVDSQKASLIENNIDMFSKCLEEGIMFNWTEVIDTIIQEVKLVDQIKKESNIIS